MVASRDFALQGVLAAGFVQNDELKPARILAPALQAWADDIYDSEPVSLPMPADFPHELPLVILRSRDGQNRLEIARGRVNVHWRRVDGQAVDLLGLCSELVGRMASVFEFSGVAVGRLGIVVSRAARHSEPGATLARQFCRDEKLRGPLNRPEGFELHAHKVFTILGELSVNSWMRIKTEKDGEVYSLIAVEQDINTLASERLVRNFSRERLLELAAAFGTQFEQILDLYFPEDS